MSIALTIIYLLFSLYLIIQFGHKISAKHSPTWWLALIFTLIALINPSFYEPLTAFLGIELVSNFIIAALLLFLFKQMLENMAIATTTDRKLREHVCRSAAERFLEKKKNEALSGEEGKRVLILLPTYNEAESLPGLIPQLIQLKENVRAMQLDICFVDDGSRDQSGSILRSMIPEGYVSLGVNMGVSAALLTGFQIAYEGKYDYVVQCDADGQHPIESIPKLVQEAEQANVDLLIASRYQSAPILHSLTKKRSSALDSTTIYRRLGSWLIAKALLFFRRAPTIHDPTSGFRVYSRKAMLNLLPIMPDDYPEPESIALLAVRGMTIKETPVRMDMRRTGVSSLSGFKSFQYMAKVVTSLISLRLRSSFKRI